MRSTALALVFGVTLAACGFSVSGMVGGSDDTSGDDAQPPGTPTTLVDDSAQDFRTDGSTLVDGVIADRGVIEPDAFVTNGLHAAGYAVTGKVTSTTTWQDLQDALPKPLGAAYSVVPHDWVFDRPHGLGLTSNDNFTVILDGEIKLQQGMVDIAMDMDDRGLLQLSLDGGANWTSLYDDTGTTNPKLTVPIPATGWYPIRIAFEENGVNARAAITAGPTGTNLVPLDATMLRSRVTSSPGLLVHAFNTQFFQGDVGESSILTLDADFTGGSPAFDLGINADKFTLRFSGQIYIDADDSYAFAVSTNNELWRVIVDGALVATNLTMAPNTTPMAAPGSVQLAPGWHDLVVDFTEDTGPASVKLSVMGGSLAGDVPAERLRPAAVRALIAAAYVDMNKAIADATSAAPSITEMTLQGMPVTDAIVDSVDWGYQAEGHNPLGDLAVELVCAPVTATGHAGPMDGGGTSFTLSDPTCANNPMPAAFTFRATDSVMNNSGGNLRRFYLAMTYHGGATRQPFAQKTVYVSAPKMTPGAIGYGAASVAADATGATVELAVRTADALDALEAADWVTVANDSVPAVSPHALIQYQVTITQDGWHDVSVDRVSLIYLSR